MPYASGNAGPFRQKSKTPENFLPVLVSCRIQRPKKSLDASGYGPKIFSRRNFCAQFFFRPKIMRPKKFQTGKRPQDPGPKNPARNRCLRRPMIPALQRDPLPIFFRAVFFGQKKSFAAGFTGPKKFWHKTGGARNFFGPEFLQPFSFGTKKNMRDYVSARSGKIGSAISRDRETRLSRRKPDPRGGFFL